MSRRFSITLAAAGCAAALLAASSRATAAPKDKEAMKLHDSAMDEDYLNTEFGKAEKKLKDAVKACGADGCAPKILGRIYIALGTVYAGGLGKADLAKEAFIKALQTDPKAVLNEDLATDETKKAFKEAKAAAKDAPKGETAQEKPAPTEEPKKKPKDEEGGEGDEEATGDEEGDEERPRRRKRRSAESGDFAYTPPAEAEVNTPLPIYVEVPEELGAARATLRYKPFGAQKWKTKPMQEVGDGFGAEIPCDELTTTGDLKFTIKVETEEGDPVGSAGTLKKPLKIQIKNEVDEQPRFPGKPAPKQCAVKEDCPPGLPGCPAGKERRGDKGWGSSCEDTKECKAGLICLNGSCEEGTPESDGDGAGSGAKKFFLSLQVQADVALLNSGSNVCSDKGDKTGYFCFHADNPEVPFYGAPVKGSGGVDAGTAFGGVRALVGVDYILWRSLVAGARIGYSFGGSPTVPEDLKQPDRSDLKQETPPAFMPFHLEGRGSWFFGAKPFEQKFRPFAMLGGGFGQIDAMVPVEVKDQYEDDGETKLQPDGTFEKRQLNAWQKMGRSFIAAGGGVMYAPTPTLAVTAELKAMFLFTSVGFALSPTIGGAVAF